MSGRFHKMHGLGNDFVVIDARADALAMTPARAAAIADRHTGIGCDQLIMLEASDAFDKAAGADARMRIWNADGGEVGACGNAARAIGVLIGDAVLETAGGTIATQRDDAGASVDMGEPRFQWDAIPLAYPLDTAAMPVAWDALTAPAAVNVGNPHVVFIVADVAAIDLASIGPVIEHDALFPEAINVSVVQVTGPQALCIRTWERGAGLTRACGTGACASAVVALRRGLVTSPVTVALPGGELVIEWTADSTIRMSGPATHVFSGEIDWDTFAL